MQYDSEIHFLDSYLDLFPNSCVALSDKYYDHCH